MHWEQKICAAAVSLVAVTIAPACGALKSSSSDGSPVSPSASNIAKVRASDVLSGAAVSGATVAGSGVNGGTTDTAGALTITASEASTFGIDVSSPSYVTRNTLLKVPGADASISLIGNTFHLTAFNEMFRADAIRRWTSTPALRVVSHVVDLAGEGYAASSEPLTDSEIAAITSDMAYGLPLFTGGAFSGFSGVSTLRLTPGAAVTLAVEGSITFARCRGVTAARGAAGFAQILYFPTTNVVTGAFLCIDRDFELSNSSAGRAVRLHELGHTLGALHVTSKDHVLMNPTIAVTDITSWDRDASRIAYQRPPGNRSPDRDPSSYSTNRLAARVLVAEGCRVR